MTEIERYLKKLIKKKYSYSDEILVKFLMVGFLTFGVSLYGADRDDIIISDYESYVKYFKEYENQKKQGNIFDKEKLNELKQKLDEYYQNHLRTSTFLENVNNNNISGPNNIVLGENNVSENSVDSEDDPTISKNNIIFGKNNILKGDNTLLIGSNLKVEQKEATANNDIILGKNMDLLYAPTNSLLLGSAIGSNSLNNGNIIISNSTNDGKLELANVGMGTLSNTIAMVNNSKGNILNGYSLIGIGNDINMNSNESIGIGNNNNISGQGSVVIGNSNQVEKCWNSDVFVLGNNIKISGGKNGVVLGNESEFVNDAVSIGAKGKERKLVNLENGVLQDSSTEAITGNQLFSLGNILGLSSSNMINENQQFNGTTDFLKLQLGNNSEVEQKNYKQAINDITKQINTGMSFNCSLDSNSSIQLGLGETLHILGSDDIKTTATGKNNSIKVDLNKTSNISPKNERVVTSGGVANYLANNYYNKREMEFKYLERNSEINLKADGATNGTLKLLLNPTLSINGDNKNIQTDIKDNKVYISMNTTPTFDGINVAGVTISSKNQLLNELKNLSPEERKQKLQSLGLTEESLKNIEPGLINVNGYKLSYIADGEVAAGSKAAVNGGQLYEVNKIAETANKNTIENKNLIDSNKGEIATNKKLIIENKNSIENNEKLINENKGQISINKNKIDENKKTIDINTENINKGINIVTTNDEVKIGEENIKLGEAIQFSNGNNIQLDLKNNGINIGLKNSLVLETNQPNSTLVINSNNSGIIRGLANGTENSDAVNLGQIKPLSTALNMEIDENGKITTPNYNLGKTGNFNNIQDALSAVNKVAETGVNGKIIFSDGVKKAAIPLNGEITHNVVKNGLLSLSLDPDKRTYTYIVNKDPIFEGKITAKGGFDASNNKITGLAPGQSDTDAATMGQLKEIKSVAGNTVSLALNAPVAYEVNLGTVQSPQREIVVKIADKDGKTSNFYKKSDFENGKLKNGAQPLTDEQLKTLKVSVLDKNQGIATSMRCSNVGAGDISDISNDAINGSQLKPVLDSLGMSWNETTNKVQAPSWNIGAKTYSNVQDVIVGSVTGEIGTVVITDGEGNSVVRVIDRSNPLKPIDKGFYKISDLDQEKLKEGQFVIPNGSENKQVSSNEIVMSILDPISGKTIPEENGKNARRLTNVGAGKSDYEAVNMLQLKDAGLDLTKNNQVVTYDTTDKTKITLGGVSSSGNLIKDKGVLITNVKEGKISKDSTDAVNGGQLYATQESIKANEDSINNIKTEIGKGWTLKTGSSSFPVKLEDTVELATDKNLSLTGENVGSTHKLNFKLNDNIKVGNVKINGEKNNSEITGLKNTTWNKDIKPSEGRAATEEQLSIAIKSMNDETSKEDKFNVKYDKVENQPNYSKITLGNRVQNGTIIDNLGNGEVSNSSKQAINGSQIYSYISAINNALVGSQAKPGNTINALEINVNDNNGYPYKFNNVKEAIESLNHGWRVVGGVTPKGNSFDSVAGATNIERGQTLGILGSGNIATKLEKRVVSLYKEYDATNVVEKNGKYYAKSDTNYSNSLEKIFKNSVGEVISSTNVIEKDGKYYEKNDTSNLKPLDVIYKDKEKTTSQIAFVNIKMADVPEFEGIKVKEKGIVAGKVSIDSNGSITGLKNSGFESNGKSINLSDVTDTNSLSLTPDKAATEGQLKEIINDYKTRTSSVGLSVLYDTENKTEITLGGLDGSGNIKQKDGVILSNVKAGKVEPNSTEAVNGGQLYELENKIEVGMHKKGLGTVIYTGAQGEKLDVAKDIQLSLVNIDGSTNNAVVLRNVASTMSEIADASKAVSEAAKKLAENPLNENLQNNLSNAQAQLKSAQENFYMRKYVNVAATVGDLQGLGYLGLNIQGNSGSIIHQNLGEILKIQGDAGSEYSDKVYSFKNIITTNEKGILKIGMKSTPEFDNIVLKGKDKNSILTVDSEGNLVVNNAADSNLVGAHTDDKNNRVATMNDISKGFTIKTQDGKEVVIKLGDTLELKALDKNLGETIIVNPNNPDDKENILDSKLRSSPKDEKNTSSTTTSSTTSDKNPEVVVKLSDTPKYKSVTVASDFNENGHPSSTANVVEITPDKLEMNDSKNKNSATYSSNGIVIKKEGKETVNISSENIKSEKVITKEVDGLKTLDTSSGRVSPVDKNKAVNGETLNNMVDNVKKENLMLREQVSNALNETNKRMNKLETNMKKGVANAIAQSGVKFQDITTNQVSVGVSMGYYKGQGAVAVGVQGAPTETTRVHGIVSVVPGEINESAISVGASWKFDFR